MSIAPDPTLFEDFEATGLKFELQPLREVLRSPLFERFLQEIWEPQTCFSPPPVAAPRLGLSAPGGSSLLEILAEVREKVARHAVNTRHPWALAHMTPPPATASVLADFLVGALNQCAFIWEEAPLAEALEAETVAWLARRLGLGRDATGILTSGGTLSNCLAAYLALAYHWKRFGDTPERLAVIATDQAHLSIRKAAALVGVGADAVISVPTDEQGRLRPGQIAAAAERALQMGQRPFLFVCTAGTSNAGVLEPPEEFLAAAQSHDAWCHIDASHGGLMVLGSDPYPGAEAWAEAESISWDPHKSLYVSYAVGSLLLKEPSLRAPLEFHSEYALKEDDLSRDAGAWHLEGSRRLDALKLWIVIRHLGDEGIDALTDHSLTLARVLADEVEASGDFELMTAPDTNVVCFRFVSPSLDETELDELNRRLQRHLYQSGGPLVSSTRVGGRAVLRTVLMNPALEVGQLGEILDAIRVEGLRQLAELQGQGRVAQGECA
jgi:L-2,4-diaminobutyrate decarboxylase